LQKQQHFFQQFENNFQLMDAFESFFVNDSEIEASDIDSLELFLSGETISIRPSQRLLSGLLGNDNLERLLLDCSKFDIQMTLSELKKERLIEMESVDVSVVSIEALDSSLLN
jgi:hypothetical protein